jgi:hypothetical protein
MAEVLSNCGVNSKFNIFMDTILYDFNIAFPLKSYYVREPNRNRWITQGLKISSKRMHFLNSLRKNKNLTKDTQDYVTRYRVIYEKVIRGAKKRVNVTYVANAQNKTKAMWQILSKEIGNSPQYKKKLN